MNLLQKKIAGLESEIKEASQKYYSDGTSPLTDDEFDDKVEELRELSPDSDVINQVGWGYDVDTDSTPGEKFKHKYGIAGSLSKCRTWPELKGFQNEWIDASLKLDGLSIVMYYKDGKRYQSLTRGDGETGIDVSPKIDVILPKELLSDKSFTGAIRGEIVMSHENFAEFKELHPEAKNARNSAVGLIGADAITDEIKFLDVVVYNVVGYVPGTSSIFVEKISSNTAHIRLFDNNEFLAKQFEKVAPRTLLKLDEENFMQTLETLKEKWYSTYPADGIVLTHTEADFDKETKYLKYNAIAFKFKAEGAESTVQDIEWNLTKTKYLMPKIKIDPVELSGTTVQYATCYNAKYVKENRLGPGATVSLSKHGEIIPNIDEVIEGVDYELPSTCPACGELLIWDGVHLKCPNPDCSDSYQQDLLIWMHTLAPIDNLGDELIIKYFLSQYPESFTISDLMHLNYQILACEYSETEGHRALIGNMFKQLFTGNFAIVDAIKALNIPRIGDKTAEKLAQYPGIIDRILTHGNIEVEHVINLGKLIGEANAASIAAHIHKFLQLNLIKDRIIWNMPTLVETKGVVAITGKLSVPRNEFIAELKSFGYEVKDISKNTQFLITDDPNSNSSKNQKADALGITKITEAEFRSKYL